MIFILVPGACQFQPDISQPPEILFGEDICSECGMIISEARYAAVYYTPTGEARRFDDIDGMLTHHTRQQEEVADFWVHDYETEQWIIADQACFVSVDELHTPMGFSLVAFSDRLRAQKLADQSQSMVMCFDEIIGKYMLGSESHDHPQL